MREWSHSTALCRSDFHCTREERPHAFYADKLQESIRKCELVAFLFLITSLSGKEDAGGSMRSIEDGLNPIQRGLRRFMATFISSEHMKLSEALQLQNYNNEASFIKDVEKKSKLMQILPWYPTQDGSILHKGVKAASLPKGKFGAINKAIPTGQASTKNYEVSCKFYELKSDVDTRILEGLTAEKARRVRAGRDRLYAMGYMQSLANEIIKNDGTDPDAVMGILPRRASISDHVISAGGTADGTNKLGSILLIRPGEDGVCLRYPTASGPNMRVIDEGKITALELDSAGKVVGSFPAYETIWRTYYGIDINDEDALYRIVNVPTNKALAKAQIDTIIDVVNELDDGGAGFIALCPKQVIAQFWKYLNDKGNIAFTKREVEGMGQPMFLFNVPLFYEEYMSSDEGLIS